MKKASIEKRMPEKGEKESDHGKMSPFGYLFRFIGWWFGFTGLYATFAVCPFCGQQGCPVGAASAGTVGAFFALCVQDWKRLAAYIRKNWRKQNKHKEVGSNNAMHSNGNSATLRPRW